MTIKKTENIRKLWSSARLLLLLLLLVFGIPNATANPQGEDHNARHSKDDADDAKHAVKHLLRVTSVDDGRRGRHTRVGRGELTDALRPVERVVIATDVRSCCRTAAA